VALGPRARGAELAAAGGEVELRVGELSCFVAMRGIRKLAGVVLLVAAVVISLTTAAPTATFASNMHWPY
jgi:hypothetical protein